MGLARMMRAGMAACRATALCPHVGLPGNRPDSRVRYTVWCT